MRILYIGSSSPLSWKPLKALLRLSQRANAPDKLHICAIARSEACQHNTSVNIPVVDIRSDSLESLAYTHNIPLVNIYDGFMGMDKTFKAYQPDIIIVSCFAYKIPDSIRNIAPSGCFNIHPSLLPRYRGADPLFWQFRAEKCIFGTSLHRMSDKMDAGDIILQKALVMPDGVNRQQATHLLAHSAGELLLQFIDNFLNGILVETPQNHKQATWQASPMADDYIIYPTWRARSVYNFICACEQPGRYFKCIINSQVFRLKKALYWQPLPSPDSHSTIPYKKEENTDTEITITCSTGLVRCLLYI